jgi:hypothetical protein
VSRLIRFDTHRLQVAFRNPRLQVDRLVKVLRVEASRQNDADEGEVRWLRWSLQERKYRVRKFLMELAADSFNLTHIGTQITAIK